MIKKILIGLGVIVVVLVVAVAAAVMLTPTDFAVERAVVINKPRAEVFEYAKLLKNQNDWGPWAKRDAAIKQEYAGADGAPGFVSKWTSQDPNVGSGEQEIKKITPGERIDTELRFKEPFESKADSYLITEDAGEGKTKVRWGFTGSMPRPMNLMLLAMDMDKEIGKDFDEGLASLKGILESQ